MRIEILSSDLREFTIEGRKFQQQTGWVQLRNEPYPREVRFTVDAAFPPGEYLLDLEASLNVRNAKLQLGRFRLVRPPAAAAAAAK